MKSVITLSNTGRNHGVTKNGILSGRYKANDRKQVIKTTAGQEALLKNTFAQNQLLGGVSKRAIKKTASLRSKHGES
jgi:hypothetical protein